MAPVTSLLTASERQDVAALNDLIEHDGMIEEHFTYEEAAALWDAGWQEWLEGDRNGNAPDKLEKSGVSYVKSPGSPTTTPGAGRELLAYLVDPGGRIMRATYGYRHGAASCGRDAGAASGTHYARNASHLAPAATPWPLASQPCRNPL